MAKLGERFDATAECTIECEPNPYAHIVDDEWATLNAANGEPPPDDAIYYHRNIIRISEQPGAFWAYFGNVPHFDDEDFEGTYKIFATHEEARKYAAEKLVAGLVHSIEDDIQDPRDERIIETRTRIRARIAEAEDVTRLAALEDAA